jgi:hypothetical protein
MSTMTDSTLTYVFNSKDAFGVAEIAGKVERVYGFAVRVAMVGSRATLYVDRNHPNAVPAWDYARELYDAALQGRPAYRAAIRGNVVDADAFHGSIGDALDVEDMIAGGLLSPLAD